MRSPVPTPRALRSERGFAISELVLVLVVVAALIAVVVISLDGIDDQSAERECQTELRAIKAASEQFYAELNFYPPNDQALKDANLMELSESPNWRVVTEKGETEPTYEPVGSRCA
jgi:type II secretory pathway pseudopilin PulG